MNAAVLHTINQPPHFEQFPEPVAARVNDFETGARGI